MSWRIVTFNLEMMMLPMMTGKTMTSLEIAGLVESNHADVKRSIKRLAGKSVIQLPPTAKVQDKQSLSPNNKTEVYVFDASHKRDTYIVVAQLSPEFTARVVDRWQELEGQQQPAIPKTYAQALQLAADQAKQIEYQAKQIEAAKPAIEFQQRVATADDCHTLDEVAKILRIGPRKLRQWMRDEKVLRLDGMPASYGMDNNLFRVIEKPIRLPFGNKLHKQVLVTGKGLQYLQRKIDHTLMGQEI